MNPNCFRTFRITFCESSVEESAFQKCGLFANSSASFAGSRVFQVSEQFIVFFRYQRVSSQNRQLQRNNTEGSFNCSCKDGLIFSGDGINCAGDYKLFQQFLSTTD